MSSRAVAVVVAGLGLVASRPAAAEPRKLLVLQSEGRVEAATRARIDQAILKLARAGEPQAALGDLNFGDAATAVGCKPDASACKDEVLAMLAVDELVITTVARKPGGIELAVQRVARGGASREATMLLATGTPPDKLDGIAPLFGDPPPGAAPVGQIGPAAPAAPAAPIGPIGPAAPPPAPAPHAATTERPVDETPVIPPPTEVTPPEPSAVTTPAAHREPQIDAPDQGRRRLELLGMVGGGSMVLLGFVLWGAASGVQSDIDSAPTTTQEDLAALRDLESKGDTYAALGNVFTVTGLVVGGVSTYLFIRDRRAAATASARLSPAVFDHGAGLVLTIGGRP
jgi:hypothetical protein